MAYSLLPILLAVTVLTAVTSGCPKDVAQNAQACVAPLSNKDIDCRTMLGAMDCLEHELGRCQEESTPSGSKSMKELAAKLLVRIQTYRQQLLTTCGFVQTREVRCSFRQPEIARRMQSCTDLTRGLDSHLSLPSRGDPSCRALLRGVNCWLDVAADCPRLVPDASVLEFQYIRRQLQKTCSEDATETMDAALVDDDVEMTADEEEGGCPDDYLSDLAQCPTHLAAIKRLKSTQNDQRCMHGRAVIACYDRLFRLCPDKPEVTPLMSRIDLDGARQELRHLCPDEAVASP